MTIDLEKMVAPGEKGEELVRVIYPVRSSSGVTKKKGEQKLYHCLIAAGWFFESYVSLIYDRHCHF